MCAYPERSTTTISIGKSKSTPTATLVLLLRPFGACPKGVLRRGPRGPPRSQAARGGGWKGWRERKGPPSKFSPKNCFAQVSPIGSLSQLAASTCSRGWREPGSPSKFLFNFFFHNFFPEGLQRLQAPRWCSRKGVLPSPKREARRASQPF